MIFGIDEDGIVGASGHAGFATDADRFVKIHDAIGALEHCGGGARGYTGCMRALIAARHLMRATCLRKLADVDVLDVGTRNR